MGYARGEDDIVILEEDELDSIALASTRTIEVEKFVPKGSVDWVWYDTPYFLVPDDKVGVEAYSVIREAMVQSGTAGLARLVLHRRERPVMLVPRDRGMVLWTLRYGDEGRDPGAYEAGLDGPVSAAARRPVEAALAGLARPWSAELTQDPVQNRLLEIIEAKRRKARRPTSKRPAQKGTVIDLTEALRRSLRPGRR
jgi:DNA end-binding protein Ku